MTRSRRLEEVLTQLGAGEPEETVQDTLRRALSDPTLEVVYVRVGSGGWIDRLNKQTVAPEPAADGRVFTPIERGGRAVAGILHDAALAGEPEVLRACIDAVSRAIDSEYEMARVQAELLALQASRARILEAGDRQLRRVERDLHDGAQQRLVGLALMLRLASRSAADDSAVTGLLAEAARELDDAIAELRELTRGIHPYIVDDAGLGGALETLAERPGIPVELRVDLPRRLPKAIEVAAYYFVAETLANANKHSNAHRTVVCASVASETLHLEVVDDGDGGARATHGSGLEGLTDRVAALQGVLRIDSPPGAGTRITAAIPLAATLVPEVERRRMAALRWFVAELWDMPPEAADQITDDDNLTDGKAILLCAGGNALVTAREREWLIGYLTAANDAPWVLDAVESFDDSVTLEDLMLVPGFANIARGALYDAIRMCMSDGPLTTVELDHLERAADAMEIPREVVADLHEIVVAEHTLRRRRHQVIAAPVLPR